MSKIKYAIIASLGIVAGYLLYMRIHLKTIQGIAERRMRDYHDLRVMEKLMENIQNNHGIERFFGDNQYHTIGVYGMGIVGSAFYRELNRRSIPVEFCVDINNRITESECKMVKENDDLPKVDVMVVTDDFYFDKHYKKLAQSVSGDIISIVDVLYDVGLQVGRHIQ